MGRLPPGASPYGLLAPVPRGGFLPAEHPLAGARGIHQDPVKEPFPARGQAFGRLVQNHRVRDAAPVQVLRQGAHAARVDFVGDQDTPVLHPRGQVGGFPAGRGTEVQYPLAGLGGEERGSQHGGRVLEVIKARFVVGVDAGAGRRFGDDEAFRAPGDRLQGNGERASKSAGEIFSGLTRRPRAGGACRASRKAGNSGPNHAAIRWRKREGNGMPATSGGGRLYPPQDDAEHRMLAMFTSTMESRQGCPYRLLAVMDYTTGPTPLHGNTFVGQLRAVVLQLFGCGFRRVW
jgi:hypothetical protein